MGSFFQELRRRSVFKVAAVYAVTSWLVIQIAGEILPTFEAPIWINQVIILFFALGFPVALITAWAFELTPEGVTRNTETSDTAGPVSPQGNNSVLIALMALAVGFLFVDRYLIAPQDLSVQPTPTNMSGNQQQVIQSAINLEVFQRRPGNGNFTWPSLSRDGTLLGYTGYVDANYKVWIRALDEMQPSLVYERSDNWVGMNFKISPDNQTIAFNDSAGLHVIPITGGVPRFLAPASFFSYNWISNEEIIFSSPETNGVLQIVSIVDGEQSPLLPDDGIGEIQRSAMRIAGTKYLLFTRSISTSQLLAPVHRIELLNLETLERHVLLDNAFSPSYLQSSETTGHILYMRNTDLWAAPFDLDELEFIGRDALVVSGIEIFSAPGAAGYSISDNGRLIYMPGSDVLQYNIGNTLTSVNASGEQRTLDLPLQRYVSPRVSPDGERLAITVRGQNGLSNIWVYNFQTGRMDPLTFSGFAEFPLWSPDGSRVYFSINRDLDNSGIYVTNADGTGAPELLLNHSTRTIPGSIDAVSGTIIFQGIGSGGFRLMFQATYTDGNYVVKQILPDSQGSQMPSLSENSRWLVYTSSESGREEVYLRQFPDIEAGGKWQITSSWADNPVWSENGRELYYRNLTDGKIMRVAVLDDAGVNLGIPSEAFDLGTAFTGNTGNKFVLKNDESEAIFVSGNDVSIQFEQPELVQARMIENLHELVERIAPVGFD